MASTSFTVEGMGTLLHTIPPAFQIKRYCDFTVNSPLLSGLGLSPSGTQIQVEHKPQNIPKGYDTVIMKAFTPPMGEDGSEIFSGPLVEMFIFKALLEPHYKKYSDHFSKVYDAFYCDDNVNNAIRKIVKNEAYADMIIDNLVHQGIDTVEKEDKLENKTVKTITQTMTTTRIKKLWFLSLKQESKAISFFAFLLKIKEQIHTESSKTKEEQINESVEELVKVIFQILIACEAMNVLGIRHNDLFLHNISVVELDEVVSTTYKVGDKSYTIRTKWKPIILDFEKATVHKNPPIHGEYEFENPTTKLASNKVKLFGNLHERNPKVDTFTILFSIYDALIQPGRVTTSIWASSIFMNILKPCIGQTVLLKYEKNEPIKLADPGLFQFQWMKSTRDILNCISKKYKNVFEQTEADRKFSIP